MAIVVVGIPKIAVEDGIMITKTDTTGLLPPHPSPRNPLAAPSRPLGRSQTTTTLKTTSFPFTRNGFRTGRLIPSRCGLRATLKPSKRN
jgi:hypothetical protein